jgi:membrane protease YdiL (CAAX protease family)
MFVTRGGSIMVNTNQNAHDWIKKGALFVLFFILGTMVFAIITFSPYVSGNTLLIFHMLLTAALLVVAMILRRSEKGKPYWPVFYVFFVAGAAVLISTLFSDDLLRWLNQSITTPQGIALAKFSESILRVIPILVLMLLMGFNWHSMYLKTGKIRLWLPIAIAAWIVFPAFAYISLSSGQPGVLDKLLPLWPWILLFVLSNGFMEELLYRGIFLKQYEPFLGKRLSIVLTAIVFALMHTQVTYAAQMIQFLVIVLVLSLVWGILIQKSDSLWGAVLFHAAGDCLVIFGAFVSI